jgi:hypothetical protein
MKSHIQGNSVIIVENLSISINYVNSSPSVQDVTPKSRTPLQWLRFTTRFLIELAVLMSSSGTLDQSAHLEWTSFHNWNSGAGSEVYNTEGIVTPSNQAFHCMTLNSSECRVDSVEHVGAVRQTPVLNLWHHDTP